jgi:hypothetical protein
VDVLVKEGVALGTVDVYVAVPVGVKVFVCVGVNVLVKVDVFVFVAVGVNVGDDAPHVTGVIAASQV